jgi:hypothetical protein
MGKWPETIGRFITNFGGIELMTYHYLNALEPTKNDFDKNLGNTLSRRITRVLELIEVSTTLSPENKTEMTFLWREVLNLAPLRNKIAHNPVLPHWEPGSDSENAPPDSIGVPDMQEMKEGVIAYIPFEGMERLVNDSCDIAQKLHRAAKMFFSQGQPAAAPIA